MRSIISRPNIRYSLAAMLIGAALLASAVTPGYARELSQTVAPTLSPAVTGDTAIATATPAAVALPATATPIPDERVVGFGTLGFVENRLYGPYDSDGFFFSLPATWELTPGSQLQLDFTTIFGGTSNSLTPRPAINTSGTLEVQFNGVPIHIAQLDQPGLRTLVIPIPTEALLSPSASGRHELGLFLTSPLSCDLDYQISVAVHSTSLFIFPHNTIAPLTSLSIMPRPIYQDTYLSESAVMVIPDDPAPAELEAALDVAAGFGQMSGGRLFFSTVPFGQLTPELMAAENLIFVGKPAAFPSLATLTLPAPITDSAFSAPSMQPEDGILQMAVSPWNPAKVVLIVSGNDDSAVIKSARALSSGVIRTTSNPSLALVEEARQSRPASNTVVDRTLASLGYQARTITGVGTDTLEYTFYVPSGQVAAGDTYIDLLFRHSAELNFQQSAVIVTLNDTPTGSVRFTEETAQNGKARINFSNSQLQPGVNRLRIETSLFPTADCVDPRLSNIWVTVLPESTLHLPLRPAGNTAPPTYNLNQYLGRYASSPTLNNVAVIVPKSDPAAINVAAQLAYALGNQTNLTIAELTAAYGDGVPNEIKQERDLLIVGKPASLPIIGELAGALPAPFEAGSNQATEKTMPIVYRIPPDVSLGYLEFIAAPWAIERTALVVAGTTDVGVQWAGTALIQSIRRSKLEGSFAVVDNDRVIVDTSQLGLGIDALAATAAPGVVTLPEATPAPSIEARPSWIMPVVQASAGVMAIIIVGVLISGWVQRRRSAGSRANPPLSK